MFQEKENDMKIKKCMFALLMALLAVSLFAGGGGQKSTASGGGEKITIRLLTRMSGAEASVFLLEQAKREFSAKYPDVIIQDESKNDSNAYTQQFVTDIASGNIADVFTWPGISIMKDYAINGVFLDISELIKNDPDVYPHIDKTILAMMDLSGIGVPGIYALPTGFRMETFYYNKDLFAKAGIAVPPKTFDEFYDACDKLLKIGVIPWSIGLSNKWRAIHISNGLIYRTSGVQKGIDLGAHKAKWTDPDVVSAVEIFQDMARRGYFGKDYAGIDYETEKARFITGETAMTFDGSWRTGDFTGDVLKRTGSFRMPYFKDKPQFYEHDIGYPEQIEMGGHLKNQPEKRKLVWEFIRQFVEKPLQAEYVYRLGTFPVRDDVTLEPSKVSPIFLELLNYRNKEVKVFGTDIWSYDTLPVMEDVVGDGLVGALTGMSAIDACRQIQRGQERAGQ
jgi:ABC-type glycerol-3-phosphate transport system substrate-binding protein